MEGSPRVFYGPFACMLLHEPYLWMRNWTPTIENTADLNSTNPAFSLSIASRGRDIISSQIDRDAYLMDIARLPAEMRLMPTCTGETDRLELPGPNALLRMSRESLEAARVKLEALVREIQTQAEIFGRNMLNIVVLYDTKTTPNEGIPYIQLPLQAMAKKLEELRGTLACQLEHTIRVLSLHGPPGQLDPRRGVDPGMNSNLPQSHAQMMQLNAGGSIPRHLMDMPGGSNNVEEPWRPQRGLPERSVTLLRHWLFENFLHPYPKDSDKQLLARRAGLSRNQVSNWFINARVRLWKPMVEVMCEIDPEDDLMHADEDAGNVENAELEAMGAHDQQAPPNPNSVNDRVNELANQDGRILRGDHYPAANPQAAAGHSLLIPPHTAGTGHGTDSGLFQGLDPGSQSRLLSWRAEMEHDMQTWISIASGAQHERSPMAQAGRFNVPEHHLANFIPLELGLPEPRNHFDMLGERERTQNLSAHLGSTMQMAGSNQGQPSNLFLALDSQRTAAANLFGPSTLGYSWNHQQSVTLSLSNPESFPSLGLPLGAAFTGFNSSPGFAQDHHGNDHSSSAAGGVSLTLGLQLRNPDLPSAMPETRISNSLPLLDNFNPGFSYNGHADLDMPPGPQQ